jgi:hypothetical protein
VTLKPPSIGPIPSPGIGHTLAEDLVSVVDDIRQLPTEFGVRPYRIFLLWVGWTPDVNADGIVSGGELLLEQIQVGENLFQQAKILGRMIHLSPEGAGRPVLLAETELLPTPRFTPRGLTNQQRAEGLTESGRATADRISASYSEDVLMGLIPQFRDPRYPEQIRPGTSFFWEIRENRPARYRNFGTAGADFMSDLPATRRRWNVAGTPVLERGAAQWVVELVRADGERNRLGELG